MEEPKEIKMLIDYHIHTELCGHATGRMQDYVKEAVNKGFNEIGFSDHLPFINKVAPHLAMPWKKLPYYIEEVNRLSCKYSDTIKIKTGIEVDYEPHLEDRLGKVLERYDFDYVYGSVHNIGDWLFDSPRQVSRWEDCDVEKTYQEYFALVQKAAASSLFDIVAHLDLVKKFGYRPEGGYFHLIQETLDIIETTDIAIELNTAGLRRPVGEVYPGLETLKECIRRGIPITIGSDAHKPEEVGWEIPRYMQELRTLGLKEMALFSRRKRDLVKMLSTDFKTD